MRSLLALFFLVLLTAGCTTAPDEPVNAQILHYVRSNVDGTKPENVVMYRATPHEIHVYKYIERCTRAAYVTGYLDMELREPVRLVAGKVGLEGEQVQLGEMRLSQSDRVLFAQVETPNGAVRDELQVPDKPWHLYDFDLASLNAVLQQHPPSTDFSFGLALVWPEQGADDFLRYLGRVDARLAGHERHLGRNTVRFDLVLQGRQPAQGTLWVDARGGFIVDALLGIPNHPGYRDFRLRLDRVSRGVNPSWEELLKSHYAGCPTGN